MMEAAILSATLLYVCPKRDVSRSGTVTGLTANGYTLVNLAASYDLGNRLSAYGRIDNLFDRGYQNPIGFRSRGWEHTPECGWPSTRRAGAANHEGEAE